jgi:hypothetical protein
MIADRTFLPLEWFHEDGKVVNSLKDQSMIMSPQGNGHQDRLAGYTGQLKPDPDSAYDSYLL